MAGLATAVVSAGLHRLSAAGLVYETGRPTSDSFAFRHPMVQEVVYRSIVSDRRRALHASVAADLEKTLPDPGGAQAGFIAYHFEEAGDAAKAATYNMKAATWHGTRDPAQALDAWKRGDPPEALGKAQPAIQIIDWRWRSGAKLVRYEIMERDRPVGADLRCPVQLWIDAKRDKPALEVAEYNVTTHPSLTVSRAGDR